MYFIHMHIKFQLSSFIRSRDIANLLLYTKTAYFLKTGIFEKNIPKSKSVISPLLIKLESWNLVWTCMKYIFFCSWNFIALRQIVWRWHGFENFRWIFRIGAQNHLSTYLRNSFEIFKIMPSPNRWSEGNEILWAKKYVFCTYAHQISAL